MTRLKICRKLSSVLSARLRTSTSLDDSILLTIAYVSYHRVRVEDEAHLDVDGVEDGIRHEAEAREEVRAPHDPRAREED